MVVLILRPDPARGAAFGRVGPMVDGVVKQGSTGWWKAAPVLPAAVLAGLVATNGLHAAHAVIIAIACAPAASRYSR